MSKLSIMVSVMQNNKFNHQLKSLTKVFVFALRTILITGLPAGHKSDLEAISIPGGTKSLTMLYYS